MLNESLGGKSHGLGVEAFEGDKLLLKTQEELIQMLSETTRVDDAQTTTRKEAFESGRQRMMKAVTDLQLTEDQQEVSKNLRELEESMDKLASDTTEFYIAKVAPPRLHGLTWLVPRGNTPRPQMNERRSG